MKRSLIIFIVLPFTLVVVAPSMTAPDDIQAALSNMGELSTLELSENPSLTCWETIAPIMVRGSTGLQGSGLGMWSRDIRLMDPVRVFG